MKVRSLSSFFFSSFDLSSDHQVLETTGVKSLMSLPILHLPKIEQKNTRLD